MTFGVLRSVLVIEAHAAEAESLLEQHEKANPIIDN